MTESEIFCGRFLPLSKRIYISAFNLMRNADDAKDVVQDVYVKLWELRSTLDENKDPMPLILTMTRNIAINKLKKYNHELLTDDITTEAESTRTTNDISYNVELSDMMTLVNKLPAKQRLIFTLRSCEGLEFDEIEQLTGYRQDNIRQLLSRARKQLKEMIDKY